jgi:hypothetical protein
MASVDFIYAFNGLHAPAWRGARAYPRSGSKDLIRIKSEIDSCDIGIIRRSVRRRDEQTSNI